MINITKVVEKQVRAEQIKGNKDYLGISERSEMSQIIAEATQTEPGAEELLKALTREVKRNVAIEKTIQLHTNGKRSAAAVIKRVQYLNSK